MSMKKVIFALGSVVALLWIVGMLKDASSKNGSAVVASASSQASAQDKWKVTEDRSPMDDSPTVVLSTDSDDLLSGPVGMIRPTLMIRCRQHKTDIYVETGLAASVETSFDGGPRDAHKVGIRLDDRPAEYKSWLESGDHEALFASDIIYRKNSSGDIAGIQDGGIVEFARQLGEAKNLTFEFTPFDASPKIIRFNLFGLEKHLPTVAQACGWRVEQ
jgi:type VI secretion system protein VasI